MEWREEEEDDCDLSDDDEAQSCDNFLVFLGTGTSQGVPKVCFPVQSPQMTKQYLSTHHLSQMSCVARNAIIKRGGKRQGSNTNLFFSARGPLSERGGSCPNLVALNNTVFLCT